jgi:hypothetical protein
MAALGQYPAHIVRKVQELATRRVTRGEIRKLLRVRDDTVRRILGPADRHEMFNREMLRLKSETLMENPHPRDARTGRFTA